MSECGTSTRNVNLLQERIKNSDINATDPKKLADHCQVNQAIFAVI